MSWKVRRFEECSVHEMYELLRLRSEVFVVEQDCVYQDLDDLDQQAIHLWKEDGGKAVACTRIFPAGVCYQEASIGRVIVAENHRGGDLGVELMRRSEEVLFGLGECGPIKIMAQSYLLNWYGKQGYVPFGDEFLEDGIPHTDMMKSQF